MASFKLEVSFLSVQYLWGVLFEAHNVLIGVAAEVKTKARPDARDDK